MVTLSGVGHREDGRGQIEIKPHRVPGRLRAGNGLPAQSDPHRMPALPRAEIGRDVGRRVSRPTRPAKIGVVQQHSPIIRHPALNGQRQGRVGPVDVLVGERNLETDNGRLKGVLVIIEKRVALTVAGVRVKPQVAKIAHFPSAQGPVAVRQIIRDAQPISVQRIAAGVRRHVVESDADVVRAFNLVVGGHPANCAKVWVTIFTRKQAICPYGYPLAFNRKVKSHLSGMVLFMAFVTEPTLLV
jgi:hypothetical protein